MASTPIYSYRLCVTCAFKGTKVCPYSEVHPLARWCPRGGRQPNAFGPSLCIMNECDCTKDQHVRARQEGARRLVERLKNEKRLRYGMGLKPSTAFVQPPPDVVEK